MWILGTMETLIIDMKKKYYKNQKRKVREEKRLNSLKYIIKNKLNMKRREYRINEYKLLADGRRVKVDTRVIISLTIEEAKKRGLIEE